MQIHAVLVLAPARIQQWGWGSKFGSSFTIPESSGGIFPDRCSPENFSCERVDPLQGSKSTKSGKEGFGVKKLPFPSAPEKGALIQKIPIFLVEPCTIAAKITAKTSLQKSFLEAINFAIITKTLGIQLENARKRPQKHYK